MVPVFLQWFSALQLQVQFLPGPCCSGFLTIYQFNYKEGAGVLRPLPENFYGSLLFMPALKQCEMGAKKIKRQVFLI